MAVAGAAYEDALHGPDLRRGGRNRWINYQYPGYVLGDVAAKIEAARYFCGSRRVTSTSAATRRDARGDVQDPCTEMMFDCVYSPCRSVGINSVDEEDQVRPVPTRGVGALLPHYDAGKLGIGSGAGCTASWSMRPSNPRAFMDDEPVDFTEGMEDIDTIPGPKTDEPTVRDSAGLSLRLAVPAL